MFIPIEFQKAMQKAAQTAIAITAHHTESIAPSASRFGGVPYWEAGRELPVDANGCAMALLAQINFAEVPAHDELPNKGLLQFFIPCDDELYGANLDVVGGDSQLLSVFWANPDDAKAIALKNTANEDKDLLPIYGAHALRFTNKQDSSGIDTIECAEALGANAFEVLEDVSLNDAEEERFFNAITEKVDAWGHKLLGYPAFIDGDPRENSDYRLLLQIDTDMVGDNNIMWGDEGIGQIFIHKDDLRDKQFGRCWLFWDCE